MKNWKGGGKDFNLKGPITADIPQSNNPAIMENHQVSHLSMKANILKGNQASQAGMMNLSFLVELVELLSKANKSLFVTYRLPRRLKVLVPALKSIAKPKKSGKCC
mgnify:CR=1 FL=1